MVIPRMAHIFPPVHLSIGRGASYMLHLYLSPPFQGQKRTTNGRTRVKAPSQKRKPQKLSGASISLPFARAISWKNTTNIIRPAINQAPFLLEGVVVNNQHSDEQLCYQYIALWLHRITSFH